MTSTINQWCYFSISLNKGKFQALSSITLWHDLTPFMAEAPAALQNHFAISAVHSTLNTGNVPFLPISTFHLFSLCSWPPRSVTVAMGGRRSLIGVAPDRKQLTAVQEVDNKGHTEPQASKEESECVYIYMVCVTVCKYVDHCFQWCHVGLSEGQLNPLSLLYFSNTFFFSFFFTYLLIK